MDRPPLPRLALLLAIFLVAALPALSAESDDVAARSLISQGERLSSLSKYREALPYYYRASECSPKLAEPYWHIGDNLVELDEPKKAVVALTKAIELDPKRADFYSSRSKAAFCTGNLKLSLSDIDRSIAIEPSNPFFYDKKGDIENTMGNQQNAMKDYTNAIEWCAKAKPANAKDKLNVANVHSLAAKDRGNLNRKLGKYEAAIKDYNEALAASNGGYLLEHVLFDRAECYDKLGKHDLAAKSRKLAEQSSHQWLNEVVK